MSTKALYEEGLATGRRYAEVDLEQHLGTGSPEQILREEAHYAVEAKNTHEGSRDWAAFQLGIIRGYREVCRQPSPIEKVVRSLRLVDLESGRDVSAEYVTDGPYDITDPKHSRHHEVMADYADLD